jgi:hypothetical protein
MNRFVQIGIAAVKAMLAAGVASPSDVYAGAVTGVHL